MTSTDANDAPVRAAVAAGKFYPAARETLRQTVCRLLVDADGTAETAMGVIVPHAGYAYSGSCAAAVFARVNIPPTVVLLGPDHFGAGQESAGASVWCTGAFATPMGAVSIDTGLVAELLEWSDLFRCDPQAHGEEHALEVELPFLFVRADSYRPKIVPILTRRHDWPGCAALAAAIATVVRRRSVGSVLLLASSDMTHYEQAEEAWRRDDWALAAIRRLDGAGLLDVCEERKITVCGRGPAAVVLEAARQLGARQAEVVAHTHSGMATGNFSSVVSYAGVVIR